MLDVHRRWIEYNDLFPAYKILFICQLWLLFFVGYFKKVQDYHCPIPCEIEEFISKTSTALFPSNYFADKLAKMKGIKGFPMETRMLIRSFYDFLSVCIFISSLSMIM